MCSGCAPAGDVRVCVGGGGGEDDRPDGVGAGNESRPAGAVLLSGGGAVVNVRVAGAHHERRVHGRAQLRAVHGQGRAVERARCHARLPGPGHHRSFHPLCSFRLHFLNVLRWIPSCVAGSAFLDPTFWIPNLRGTGMCSWCTVVSKFVQCVLHVCF